MRNINILINEDHTVSFENDYAGLNRENLQGNIVFKFKNFIDGEARAEVIIDGTDGYILLDKVGETYTMPIKSSLLTSDFIIMQLVITQAQVGESIPIWKSETFTLKVGFSINADATIPEEYPSWIDILETLTGEVEQAITKAENVNISSEQLTDGVKVITTNQDGEQTITIVPQGPQGEPGVPGAVKFVIVNELPSEDIQTDTIYLVPSDDPTTQDMYLEYMYINNAWELLGQKQIQVDLTDYVKNTDYATASKGGVIKSGYYGLQVDGTNGKAYCDTYTYANYGNVENQRFVSKGTLENVITGKGLVSNTDYATSSTGGVLKINPSYKIAVSNGVLTCTPLSYTDYQSAGQFAFVSKGTLDNVLTATIGDISSVIDAINGESI